MSNSTKTQQKQRVSQVVDQLINGLSLDTSLDMPSFLENAQSGYSEIKAFVEKLIDSGSNDIDILIACGERFDRDLSQRVLADLKNKGIL